MSLKDSHARLNRAVKDLFFQWEQLRIAWQDANSRYLEKTYLEPLAGKCHKAASALEYMDHQMQQARRECE